MKISVLFISLSVSCLGWTEMCAQRTSPSELRRQNRQQTTQIEVFGDDDAGFQRQDVPEKWKDESAVVLYSKMDYAFLRDNSLLRINETLRRSVKLLDQAAVDAFSEFYYRKAVDVGFKIIKPNGKEITVDLSKAVEVKTEVPDFFRTYYRYSSSYYKLAIPSLEKGDIIDFFYRTTDSYTNYGQEIEFSPFLFTLNATYPSLGQKISFSVDRGFYINFGTYNGAPAFQEGASGTDTKGRQKAFIKTYQLVDGEREKREEIRWNNLYEQNPYVKFQVIYVSPRYAQYSQYFIGEIGEVKSQVTAREVVNTVNRIVASSHNILDEYDKETRGYLKRHRVTNPTEATQLAHHYFRFKLMKNYYDYLPLKYDNLESDLISVNSHKYVATMQRILSAQGLRTEVVVAIPTTLGRLEDVLLTDELALGLRVNGSQGMYLFPFDNHAPFDRIPAALEGAQAYVFSPTRSSRSTVERWDAITLPERAPDAHQYITDMQVTIGDDFETLQIETKNTLSGSFKADYSEVILHGFDYLKADEKKFDPKYREETPRGNSRRIAEAKRKAEAAREEKRIQQKKIMQRAVEREYEVVSYDEITLQEDGRYEDAAPLVYEEKFQINNVMKKAGNNYLLEVGKLIGPQMLIEEDEKYRQADIFLSNARTFEYHITLTLPDGYQAKGLEDLNVKLDNRAGQFVAKARQEGNKLLITSKKSYKKKLMAQQEWPQLVDFLDAAYLFSQKKIILSKKALAGQ